MSDAPSLARFRPHVGETFHLHAGDGVPHAFTLREAAPLRADAIAPGPREPYMLIFQGDGPLQFHQGMYRVAHGVAGAYDLFCVPLAPTPRGPVMQVVVA